LNLCGDILGSESLTLSDHFEIRFDKSWNTSQNNQDLTPGFNGQFIPAKHGVNKIVMNPFKE
jgi:hypothetical protein